MVETELGLLTITGEDLKISKLNLETSDFVVDGKIDTISYSTESLTNKKNKGILNKIFK